MFLRLTLTALLLLVGTSSCSAVELFSLTPTPTQYIYPTALTPDVPPLTVEILQNTEYTLPGFGEAVYTYRFKDGKYAEGDASTAGYVNLTLMDLYAFGDLNGDGVNDAAVLVAANYGGTGVFVSLNAVLNEGGKPRHAAWTMVDDRPQVDLLDIRDGEITMEAIVHSFEDPACCPTLSVTRTYTILGTSLMLVNASMQMTSGGERTISLDAPLGGPVAQGVLQVTGSISVLPFENNLTLRVYNEEGNELIISPVQVTDSGQGGVFSVPLDMTKFPTGRLRIVVADLSAADGSVLALDSVEVILE